MVNSPLFADMMGDGEAELKLKEAVLNILQEASKLGLKSITLPSIGSGNAGYGPEMAATWIISGISSYLEASASLGQSLREVCFVLFDRASVDAFKKGIAVGGFALATAVCATTCLLASWAGVSDEVTKFLA